MNPQFLKLEVYTPYFALDALRSAVHETGADRFGNYEMVCAYVPVKGSWRPLSGSKPFLGEVDEICTVQEYKLEMRIATKDAQAVYHALRAVHPYEEPVIQFLPIWDIDKVERTRDNG